MGGRTRSSRRGLHLASRWWIWALVACHTQGDPDPSVERAESVYVACMMEHGFEVASVDLTPGQESVELAPHDRSLDEVLDATAECERRVGPILSGDPLTLTGDDLQADIERVAERSADGGVIGLLVRGGAETTAVAGTANAAGDALRVDSLVNVASVTKTYTAAMVYLLEDQGLLDTGRALSTHIADSAYGAVTLDQLLGHRAGVPDYAANPDYLADVLADPDRVFTTDELIAYAESLEPTETGAYAYSNTGYLLLGKVIEAVTGSTLAQAFETLIVEPFGLTRTSLVQPPEFPAELVSAWLVPANLGLPPETPLPVMPVSAPLSGCQADCGVLTTASELRVFFEALFGGSTVSAEALARMTSGGPDHGRGLEIYEGPEGRPLYGHGGGGAGYAARVAFDPTTSDLTVFLANGDAFDVDALFGAYAR